MSDVSARIPEKTLVLLETDIYTYVFKLDSLKEKSGFILGEGHVLILLMR